MNYKLFFIKNENAGISLVALIITIVSIIIIASITIFTGFDTPDNANLAKFSTEITSFQVAVRNDYSNRFGEDLIEGKMFSDSQFYYMIAKNVELSDKYQTISSDGLVSELGEAIANGFDGTEYYVITDDRNIANWSENKKYYNENEKHCVTDKGEVFILPGYLVQEENEQKWWINATQYYVGEPIQ